MKRKTECHLLQLVDDEGNIITHKYVIGNKEDVEKVKGILLKESGT